jgi:hypothetical protein
MPKTSARDHSSSTHHTYPCPCPRALPLQEVLRSSPFRVEVLNNTWNAFLAISETALHTSFRWGQGTERGRGARGAAAGGLGTRCRRIAARQDAGAGCRHVRWLP